MFLGHSANWWGIVLSLTAIVSALPLGILANWMTPSIKNWYAERSIAATRNRIAQIEIELQEPELSEFEDNLLLGVIATLLVASIGVIFVSMLFLTSVLTMVAVWAKLVPEVHPHGSPTPVALLLTFVGMALPLVTAFFVARPLARFQQTRSPRYRITQRKNLARLKARLDGV